MGDETLTHIKGPWRAFQMGGPSGLGFVVKRVSLVGKWGKGPHKGQTHGGNGTRVCS